MLTGIQASYIAWGAAVTGTARELLTDPDDGSDGTNDASDTTDLLRAELASDGWTSADTATKPLKNAGFSKKQIWTASKKLNALRKKDGMDGGWLWRLPVGIDPEDSDQGSKAPTSESWNLGTFEDSKSTKNPEDSAEDSEGSIILNGESSESSGDMESSVEAEL